MTVVLTDTACVDNIGITNDITSCKFACRIDDSVFSQNNFQENDFTDIICIVDAIPTLKVATKLDVSVQIFSVESNFIENGFTYVPKGKLVFVRFFDAIALFFLIMSILGIILAFTLGYVLHKYRDTYVVKSLSPIFCYLILFGAIIGFIGIISQAGTPTNSMCLARIWLPGLSFSFVFSNVFVKTWRIWRIFDNKAVRKVVLTDRELLLLLLLSLFKLDCGESLLDKASSEF